MKARRRAREPARGVRHGLGTLTGPARRVVRQRFRPSHTDKQSTLLVRTGEPVHDPAWTVTPVSMEELVLAYMNPANDIPARGPQLRVAS